MENDTFDHLARACASALPRRRAVGLLAGIGLLALSEAAVGKNNGKKKRRKKNKNACAQGQILRRGDCDDDGNRLDKPVCLGGQILGPNGDCLCPPGTFLSTDPACVGTCRPYDDRCCPGQKTCRPAGGQVHCVNPGECCRGERRCQNGSCQPAGTCCPEETVCPSDSDGCCRTNEKCCPGEGCIPNSQCCSTGSSCASDPRGCCDGNEKCCPEVGCRPQDEPCCTASQSMCGTGIARKCCDAGETCTTGTYDGYPRAACCGGPSAQEPEMGCFGVCCVTDCGICCNPDGQNPCLCC